MKLIDSNYEIIEPVDYSLDNLYKFVELCSRVCYKSEDKITSDSATKFVDRMIKSGHTSVLEHGTVYLKMHLASFTELDVQNDKKRMELDQFLSWYNYIFDTFDYNPYSVVTKIYNSDSSEDMYITTNLRVLYENALLDELKPYFCTQPEDMHECRYTVRFVCDRGVSHEFVRHRVFSFSQQSTRYCNYSKDKFNNEITICKPWWWDNGTDVKKKLYHDCWQLCEDTYRSLSMAKCEAQEMRAILPNAIKTELIMTGFTNQWEGFFELRDDKRAHPDAYKLAHNLHNEFIKRNYVYGKTNSEE